MIIYKLIFCHKNNKTFMSIILEIIKETLHIDDVLKIMNKLLNINLKNKYDIFNICSSKPVSLKRF